MSFRRDTNRHDWWKSLAERNRPKIEQLGLWSVADSEDLFQSFLETGEVADEQRIVTMSDDDFLQLEQIVKQAFPDMQDEAGFTVYRDNRLKRFGRYGS
ncbi:MAG: hypothetical protein AAF517_02885 [Planctomycetota bacterium]